MCLIFITYEYYASSSHTSPLTHVHALKVIIGELRIRLFCPLGGLKLARKFMKMIISPFLVEETSTRQNDLNIDLQASKHHSINFTSKGGSMHREYTYILYMTLYITFDHQFSHILPLTHPFTYLCGMMV